MRFLTGDADGSPACATQLVDQPLLLQVSVPCVVQMLLDGPRTQPFLQHLGAQLTSRDSSVAAAAAYVLSNILRCVPSSATAVCDTPDIAPLLHLHLKIGAAATPAAVSLASASLHLLAALALTPDGYAISAGQPLVAPAVCALLAKHYGVAAAAAGATELHHAAAACIAALTMRGKTSRKALASDAGASVLMLDSFMRYGSSISSNLDISSKVVPEDWNDEAKATALSAASTAAAAAAAACAITGNLLSALCNLSQIDESRSCLG